eukprot:m.54933 g.54933  ORF g.54933 m.54933 type:complete len:53 (-) comp15531_c0_seq2:17-175(-)
MRRNFYKMHSIMVHGRVAPLCRSMEHLWQLLKGSPQVAKNETARHFGTLPFC